MQERRQITHNLNKAQRPLSGPEAKTSNRYKIILPKEQEGMNDKKIRQITDHL